MGATLHSNTVSPRPCKNHRNNNEGHRCKTATTPPLKQPKKCTSYIVPNGRPARSRILPPEKTTCRKISQACRGVCGCTVPSHAVNRYVKAQIRMALRSEERGGQHRAIFYKISGSYIERSTGTTPTASRPLSGTDALLAVEMPSSEGRSWRSHVTKLRRVRNCLSFTRDKRSGPSVLQRYASISRRNGLRFVEGDVHGEADQVHRRRRLFYFNLFLCFADYPDRQERS